MHLTPRHFGPPHELWPDLQSQEDKFVDKLDEMALRKPEFRGGEPIELEDGNVFSIPKPCVCYRPKFGSGLVSGRTVTDLGPEFEAALDELDEVTRERSEDEPAPLRGVVDALFRLAVAMLRVNYTLRDDQLVDLLAYRPDNDDNQQNWLAIVDVARGRALKASSGGPGSAT